MSSVLAEASMVILGQTEQVADAAASVASGQIQSVWDFVVKGGPMMVPIAICSLVALTVIIERLFSLRRQNVIPEEFLSGLKETSDDESNTASSAIEYCQENGSPVAKVFATALRRRGEPVELLEKHVQEEGQREALKLRKYVRLLSVIAAISPLLGLLGTIFGMITAFQTVAMSAEALGKAELLARGIYEAMITTAAGLLVAIPALLGYHWMSSRIEHLVASIDRLTCEFMEGFSDFQFADSNVESTLRPVNASNEEEEEEEQETDGETESVVASA